MLETKTITGGTFTASEPQQSEAGTRYPVEIVLLSGRPIPEAEPLPGEPDHFVYDLSSIRIEKQRLTINYNHNDDEIIGYAEGTVILDDRGLVLKGFLIPFTASDRASEVIFRCSTGQQYEASAEIDCDDAGITDIRSDEAVEVNGDTFPGNIRVYENALVRALAVAPLGADRHTSTHLLNKQREQMAIKKLAKQHSETEITEEAAANAARPDLEEFIAEFGLKRGVQFFRDGISIDEARQIDYEELKSGRTANLSDEEPEPESKPEETPTGDPPAATPPPTEDPEKKELNRKLAAAKATITRLTAAVPRGEAEPLSHGKETGKESVPGGALHKLAAKYQRDGIVKV